MKKLTQIDKFIEGSNVQGFYICTEKFIRTTKGGDLYIDLELQDCQELFTAKFGIIYLN